MCFPSCAAEGSTSMSVSSTKRRYKRRPYFTFMLVIFHIYQIALLLLCCVCIFDACACVCVRVTGCV